MADKMNALIKYNGGHEETSPNGEWVLHLRDGIDVATNTYLHLSLYNTLEQSTPVVDFITPVPGFQARGPDTKARFNNPIMHITVRVRLMAAIILGAVRVDTPEIIAAAIPTMPAHPK